MDELRKRLEALTPEKQSFLHQQLNEDRGMQKEVLPTTGTGRRLVAYAVPISGNQPTPEELRRFLLDRLPEYMIPAMFMLMDTLPRTPNGKVDRRALPEPDLIQTNQTENLVGPRNDIEKLLVDIWANVLGFDEVGIYDNFFEMGGDSILSIQIVARAHQAGIQLTPQQLFQFNTIAALAAVAVRTAIEPQEEGPIASDSTPTSGSSEAGYTPSDFPEAGLNQEELDQFLDGITKES